MLGKHPVRPDRGRRRHRRPGPRLHRGEARPQGLRGRTRRGLRRRLDPQLRLRHRHRPGAPATPGAAPCMRARCGARSRPRPASTIVHTAPVAAAYRPEAHAVLEGLHAHADGRGLRTARCRRGRRPRRRRCSSTRRARVLYSPHELRVESRTAIGLLRALAGRDARRGVPLRRGRARSRDAARAHLARHAACRARGGLHQHRPATACSPNACRRISCSCAAAHAARAAGAGLPAARLGDDAT